VIVYNKIVRDKIPEIIANDNRKYRSKILTNDEAIKMLAEKLKEEADEFLAVPSKEEMADILEVAYSIIEKSGWKKEEVEKVRLEKNNKRGGFEKNIFLIDTD